MTALVVAALFLLFGWYFVKWNFATLLAYRLDPSQPEMRSVADWLADIAPNDPQTHVIRAAFLERTFDTNDLEQSLVEYETAAKLAPDNYFMWLELAKARDRHGDYESADAAFQRALALAPNYADVQWAAGNAYIRHKAPDKGFPLIAKAAEGNASYAGSATGLVFQLYDDDVSAVHRLLGDSPAVERALSNILVSRARYDEALDAWMKVPVDDRRTNRTMTDMFISQLIAAKQINAAAMAYADIAPNDQRPAIGKIVNGGFESGIKMRGASSFEWRIAEGEQPQVGLSDSQKHSGQYALMMNFSSFESVAFRPVDQTVPVVPGKEYVFASFYKGEIKTKAEFRWEIADAASGILIAKTANIVDAADWSPLGATFTVPAKSEGIIVRLVREGCYGPVCPVNGRLFFDDISLQEK